MIETGVEIQRIAEAFFDPSRWPLVAVAVAERMPGWRCRFIDANERGHAMDRERIPEDETGSIFSLRKAGDDDRQGWMLPLPGHRHALVLSPVLSTRNADAEFEAVAVMLRRLASAIARGARIGTRLREGVPPEAEDIEEAWDPLDYGVVATDFRLIPFATNVAAERLLESRRLFRPTPPGARLHFSHVGDDHAFVASAEEVLSGGRSQASFLAGEAAPETRIRVWIGVPENGAGAPREPSGLAAPAGLLVTMKPDAPFSLIR